MANFQDHLAKVERTMGRSLTADEQRLVKLWDLTSESASRSVQAVEAEPEVQMATYEGRFKIAFSNGNYEIYFVCPTLLLRPVVVENKDDVIQFLTQDPINLGELSVRQAMASAQSGKPFQIADNVALAEPFLRSMGFFQK